MKVFAIAVFMIACGLGFAQNTVSAGGDRDIQAIINKVEGKPKTSSLEVDHEAKNVFEEKAVKALRAFYQAALDDDQMAMYQMMSKQYRGAVNLTQHLKKAHFQVENIHVKKLRFKDDTCMLVQGTMKGIPNAQMGYMKMPLDQKMFLEDGEWVVFANPYIQMGFALPEAKNVVFPCTFEK